MDTSDESESEDELAWVNGSIGNESEKEDENDADAANPDMVNPADNPEFHDIF